MNEIQSTPDQTIEAVHEIETTVEIGQLSYRQLIWRRFRKNRMGVIAGVLLLIFYISPLGADFFAPYHYNEINMRLRSCATPNVSISRSKMDSMFTG